MYRLLKPISGAQQILLDEVQSHIKTQGLDAVSGLKGETVRVKNHRNKTFINVRIWRCKGNILVLQISY